MARNQSLKEFARQFGGLELLPRTNTGITLGDLYIKRATGKNRLEFSGYNIAYKLGLTPEKADLLKRNLSRVRFETGMFADISIRDSFSVDGDLSIPSVKLNLEGKVDRSKVLGFEIGKIKTRVLRDKLRLQIEQAIERLKNNDPKEYRHELKRRYIVEQLFYGESIKVIIAKDVDVDAAAVFAKVVGKVSAGVDVHKNQVFTITGALYPFAIDIKKIKDFI